MYKEWNKMRDLLNEIELHSIKSKQLTTPQDQTSIGSPSKNCDFVLMKTSGAVKSADPICDLGLLSLYLMIKNDATSNNDIHSNADDNMSDDHMLQTALPYLSFVNEKSTSLRIGFPESAIIIYRIGVSWMNGHGLWAEYGDGT